jgi:iron complex transport system permease protein
MSSGPALAVVGPTEQAETDAADPTGAPTPVEGRAVRRTALGRRVLWLLVLTGALVGAVALSVAIGSKTLSLSETWGALWGTGESADAARIVRDLRVPRTVVAVTAGLALGLAGALMQSLTRNPLADPGILGVNAGASAMVVLAIAVFGLTAPAQFTWFAVLGAAIAGTGVYVLGSRGRGGATPTRMVLAGTAITAALSSVTSAVVVTDVAAFSQFRFWAVGSIEGRTFDELWPVLPFVVVGALVGLAQARHLNAMALGDEAGRALGADLGPTRLWSALSVVLLCGAATALIGPVAFVGLTVPHVARAICGPDERWVFPYSLLSGAVLVLLADIVGRLVVRPGELEVGIVCALVGGPFFVLLVRRRRVVKL